MEIKVGKFTCSKTLHRVSGYDAKPENDESRDAEEDEADLPLANSLVFLKTKLLVRCMRAIKPFLLGII